MVAESIWSAIVPLVPEIAHRFMLSKLDAGVLLASSSIAVLLVSVPAGVVGDRVGVRKMTVGAVCLIAISNLLQGVAPSFSMLLLGRLLFGVGFGVLWTSGMTWLGESSGPHRTRALSLAVTTSGLGSALGPAVAGVLVQRIGLAAPFVLSAVASAVLLLALCTQPRASGATKGTTAGIGEQLRAVSAEPLILASLVLMAIGGLVGSGLNLLVPLQLSSNGLTTAWIGGAFAVAAIMFIGTSAAVTRAGQRATQAHIGALAIGITAVLLVAPLVSRSSVTMVTLLLARAPLSGITVTITFPLAVTGALRSRISTGAVLALLNLVWAASVLLGPLLAGSIAQRFGNGAAYLVLIVACALATWLLASVGFRSKGVVAR